MEIAIIADDAKMELAVQFCVNYCGILSKHNLCSAGVAGKHISDATGLSVEKLLSGLGGLDQISSRVSLDEVDMLFFFRDSLRYSGEKDYDLSILRLCDLHNVPVATNASTAEILVRALERGDVDFREDLNPKSEYNRIKRLRLGY